MPEIQAELKVRKQTISAVITRADETVEDLGQISYYHHNPFKNIWGRFLQRIRDMRR